eukprot:m.239625 g.239625  ORF g.239625 m.239625 type:complete len:155 (-) comp16069_c2_seq6:109-573(-)
MISTLSTLTTITTKTSSLHRRDSSTLFSDSTSKSAKSNLSIILAAVGGATLLLCCVVGAICYQRKASRNANKALARTLPGENPVYVSGPAAETIPDDDELYEDMELPELPSDSKAFDATFEEDLYEAGDADQDYEPMSEDVNEQKPDDDDEIDV